MAYLIIFLSIALIVGSFAWIIPSPYEKQLAAMRTRALEAGFRPKFVKFDSFLSMFPRGRNLGFQDPRRQLVRYYWQGKAGKAANNHLILGLLEGEKAGFVEVLNGSLEKSAESSKLQELAAQLSAEFEGLMALEIIDREGERMFSLYWPEKGSLADVSFEGLAIQELQSISI